MKEDTSIMEEDITIEANENIQYVINLENKVKELEDKLKKEEEKYLYLFSDMINMKRQYETKLSRIETEVSDKTVMKFIDSIEYITKLIDSIDIADTISDVDYQALLLISKSMYKALDSLNIKEINPVKEIFDEKTMNAISLIDTDNKELTNKVAAVTKKGYYNTKTNKVIQYADVIVYSK